MGKGCLGVAATWLKKRYPPLLFVPNDVPKTKREKIFLIFIFLVFLFCRDSWKKERRANVLDYYYYYYLSWIINNSNTNKHDEVQSSFFLAKCVCFPLKKKNKLYSELTSVHSFVISDFEDIKVDNQSKPSSFSLSSIVWDY